MNKEKVICNLCRKKVLKSKTEQWVGHNVLIDPPEHHCFSCIKKLEKDPFYGSLRR